jgi:hypothetical protein
MACMCRALRRCLSTRLQRCVRASAGCLSFHHMARVQHSIAIFGQLLLFCDQSMREKAWLAVSQAFERMRILCLWLNVFVVHALRSQKHTIFSMGPKLRHPTVVVLLPRYRVSA